EFRNTLLLVVMAQLSCCSISPGGFLKSTRTDQLPDLHIQEAIKNKLNRRYCSTNQARSNQSLLVAVTLTGKPVSCNRSTTPQHYKSTLMPAVESNQWRLRNASCTSLTKRTKRIQLHVSLPTTRKTPLSSMENYLSTLRLLR